MGAPSLHWLVVGLPEVSSVALAKASWPMWAAKQTHITIGWVHGDNYDVVTALQWDQLRTEPLAAADPIQGRVLPHPVPLTPFAHPAELCRAIRRPADGWVATPTETGELMDRLMRHDTEGFGFLSELADMFATVPA